MLSIEYGYGNLLTDLNVHWNLSEKIERSPKIRFFDYKESPHSNEGIQQLKTYGKFLGTLLRIYSGTLGIRLVL